MKAKIIISLLILTSTFSCKDFLDEEVISGVSYGHYQNSKGLEAGVAAAYNTLRWAYGGERLHPLQELGTDTYQEGQDGNLKPALNRYESSLNSEFQPLYLFWSNYYTGISRANIVISSIPNVMDMSEELKNIRMGEARFLRGLYYFYLVQTFGNIPIVTELEFEVKTDYDRSPVSEVYNLIISDFRNAIANLPDEQSEYGRATKGAAQHALALVYLTRGSAVVDQRGQKVTDLDSAAYFADQVIFSNNYSLAFDFKELWNINNQMNNEVILLFNIHQIYYLITMKEIEFIYIIRWYMIINLV
jgi:hypothetical protein